MSITDETIDYLIGHAGSTRRVRYKRTVTPKMRAYWDRGSKQEREEK
jgi:hypothetical protein